MISVLAAGTASGQQNPLPPGPLALLSPPPLVRIVSATTPRGAKLSRLTVRAPVGSTIVSRCVAANRRHCPYRQKVTAVTGTPGRTRTLHVEGFERSFRSGVVLELYVVKAGRTGKYTSFMIRLRNTPQRRDRCVSGLVLKPVNCPVG